MMPADVVKSRCRDNLAASYEGHGQCPLISSSRSVAADVDDLGCRNAVAELPRRGLRTAMTGLSRGRLLDRLERAARRTATRDQLVDEAGGRCAAAGDERRADPEPVDRFAAQCRDRELVEIARRDDAGVAGAEFVEQAADVACHRDEVAAVDADGAEGGTGD